MRSLTTLLFLAIALPALAQTKQDRPGIVNYTRVDAVVACGGATETTALDGLAKDGFKAVINLRMPTEAGANIEANAAHAKSLGLNYVSIPFNGQQPDPKAVDTFLATIANKANQPVFVHCGSASRVGSSRPRSITLSDTHARRQTAFRARLRSVFSKVTYRTGAPASPAT